MEDPTEEYYVSLERTYLFLSGRWNDELIRWMSSLVGEENVVLFFRRVLFSLSRLLWQSVWKSWRLVALPYGIYDPLNVKLSEV